MSCDSGIRALEYKVLVFPDPIERQSPGGIAYPENEIERMERAQTEGVIVNFGEDAFSDWRGKPRSGDRVIFALYAGQMVDGNDKKRYRLIRDKDIVAIRDKCENCGECKE